MGIPDLNVSGGDADGNGIGWDGFGSRICVFVREEDSRRDGRN